MKALVIYESFFGNTEKVARAIGEALSAGAEVEVVAVSDAGSDRLHGLDLLVLGAPTRAFKPGPATQAWLKALPPNALKGIKVAAFDTRIPANEVKSRILPVLVKFFGYAAEPMAVALAKHGGVQVAPPVGFFVKDSEGPLKDGELDRATAWGARLAAEASR